MLIDARYLPTRDPRCDPGLLPVLRLRLPLLLPVLQLLVRLRLWLLVQLRLRLPLLLRLRLPLLPLLLRLRLRLSLLVRLLRVRQVLTLICRALFLFLMIRAAPPRLQLRSILPNVGENDVQIWDLVLHNRLVFQLEKEQH
jgi:hypothetical protein